MSKLKWNLTKLISGENRCKKIKEIIFYTDKVLGTDDWDITTIKKRIVIVIECIYVYIS